MNPTKVEPGKRLAIETSFYTGRAGIVPTRTGGQLACRCDMPGTGASMSATIDGRRATITSIRPSTTDGRFTVARFVWAQEDDQ